MDEKQEYVPEVNDYVIWTNDLGTVDEGWVYWKGTPVDNEHRAKFNWRPLQNYITIETGLREKPNCRDARVSMTNKLYKNPLICTITNQKRTIAESNETYNISCFLL